MAIKATFIRGGLTENFLDAVPSAGATVASFLSYGIDSQYGKQRHKVRDAQRHSLGHCHATNRGNCIGGSAVLLLVTMGIPGSGATAIILGAFLLRGLRQRAQG